MNYFLSNYSKCEYSPGWYGTMDYAPVAEVLLYNDEDCFCVGRMESELPPDVITITETLANEMINAADDTNELIWKGDRLLYRWDEPIEGEVVTDG